MTQPDNRGDELRIPIYDKMQELVSERGINLHFVTVYVLPPLEEGGPETFHLVSSLPQEFVLPVLTQMVNGIASSPNGITLIERPDNRSN